MKVGEYEIGPTEDLVLETLAARHRLGETFWPFSDHVRPALYRLADKGLVVTMHGTVGKTTRARLTQAGIDLYVDPAYVAPVFKKYKLKKEFR